MSSDRLLRLAEAHRVAVALVCLTLSGSVAADATSRPAAATGFPLSGRVLGSRAEGVVVAERIAPDTGGEARRTELDDLGFFSFPRLEPGLWRITVPTYDGKRLQTVVPLFAAQVLAGADPAAPEETIAERWSHAAAEPAPRDVVVEGWIRAPGEAGSAAVPGLLVWIDGSEDEIATFGADGIYSLPTPRADDLVLRVAAPGYLAVGVPLSTLRGEAVQQGPSFYLRPAVTLTGCVLDEAGAPLHEARVDTELVEGEESSGGRQIRPIAWTNRDGCFAVQVARNWRVRLTAHAPGFVPQSELVDAEEPPPAVDFQLVRSATALGTVLGPQGKPVRDARVTLVGAGDDDAVLAVLAGRDAARRHPSTHTGSDGEFVLREVVSGLHALVVAAHGHEPAVVPGIRLEGGRQDVGIIVLDEAAVLDGTVVDDTGAAVEAADVHVFLVAPNGRSTAARPGGTAPTDAEGRFRVGELIRDQPIQIRVEKQGFLPRLVTAVPPSSLEVELVRAAAIAGTIVDDRRQPIAGARIRLETAGGRAVGLAPLPERDLVAVEATAGEDGAFRLEPLPPGAIELRADSACCLPSVQRVELAPGEAIEGYEIVLRAGATMAGIVLDAQGTPVPAAVVSAGERKTASEPDGGFRLTGLPAGPLTVTARHSAHGQIEALVDEAREGVELRFGAAGNLMGRVVDANGTGVAGARILIADDRASPVLSALSQRDGSFRLVLQPGRYQVRAVRAGQAQAPEAEVVVTAGEDVETVLTFAPGHLVTGRILGVSAVELGRTEVRAISTSGIATRGEIDFEGRYRIDGLPAGRWLIVAELADGRRAEAQVELRDGQATAEVDLDPTRGHRLAGQVLLDGEPLGRAWVTVLSSTGLALSSKQADAQGRFVLEAVGEDRVTVRATTSIGDLQMDRAIELPTTRDVEIDIRTGRLYGLVSPGTGGTLDGLAIEVRNVGTNVGRPARRVAVRSDGTFGPIRLAEGTYLLSVLGGGPLSAQASVELSAGRDSELHLSVERP